VYLIHRCSAAGAGTLCRVGRRGRSFVDNDGWRTVLNLEIAALHSTANRDVLVETWPQCAYQVRM